ncbi:N-acetylmuramoyl-L-alanine amidase family protein [Paenibacillus silvae]|uniref:peptidoglycan recognition protein family protein n=1 Tax=Paenibacillus silvae TaxID=1325358 RepID=UPI001F0CBED3|nr:peptidoglycan recognition family protein [Paenibacillus silvae]
MSFKMKYTITPKYLTSGTKRRSGIKAHNIKFIVAHDTGNKGSTALNNVNYYENSKNEQSASAHIFVDDKNIYECIPALTGSPEKAWHVLYNTPKDNEMFDCNANDAAIGVEYCFGANINSDESYKRYIWVMAYICYKFKLDPKNSVVGHFILDPSRKSDPRSGLSDSHRTYEQMLKDVVSEYEDCITNATPIPINKPKDDEPMTEAEKLQMATLEKTVKQQAEWIKAEKEKANMECPNWAKEAYAYYKDYISDTKGSYDFWRQLVITYRKDNNIKVSK